MFESINVVFFVVVVVVVDFLRTSGVLFYIEGTMKENMLCPVLVFF